MQLAASQGQFHWNNPAPAPQLGSQNCPFPFVPLHNLSKSASRAPTFCQQRTGSSGHPLGLAVILLVCFDATGFKPWCKYEHVSHLESCSRLLGNKYKIEQQGNLDTSSIRWARSLAQGNQEKSSRQPKVNLFSSQPGTGCAIIPREEWGLFNWQRATSTG